MSNLKSMNMKRFFVSLLCLAALQAFANPLPGPPGATIAELYFDASGKWFLEVEIWQSVDTIRISSNSADAYYLVKKPTNLGHYFVLTADSLNKQLSFNKMRDCLKVSARINGFNPTFFETDSILFGRQSGSIIDSIPDGCSINKSWFSKVLVLDSSPTIGFTNDENGTKGTIFGHFYQLGSYFESYNEKYFYFSDQVTMSTDLWAVGFPINKSCNYTAKVRATRYSISNLLIYTYSINAVHQIDFKSTDFAIYPGDSVRVDFTKATSLKVPVGKNPLFSNYPNPANDKICFVLDMPLAKPDEVFIRIYSLDGKLFQTLQPKTSNYEFDCSGMNPGTYICKMEHSGVTVASTKLLIVR